MTYRESEAYNHKYLKNLAPRSFSFIPGKSFSIRPEDYPRMEQTAYIWCIKKVDNFETALNFTYPFKLYFYYLYILSPLYTFVTKQYINSIKYSQIIFSRQSKHYIRQ